MLEILLEERCYSNDAVTAVTACAARSSGLAHSAAAAAATSIITTGSACAGSARAVETTATASTGAGEYTV